MNRRKTARDALIIVMIVVAAGLILHSRAPGPVGRIEETHDGSETGEAMMEQMHGDVRHEVSDGDPLISLGERTIGTLWFDHSVSSVASRLAGMGYEEDEAERVAKLATLLDGLDKLIQAQTIEELGIEPDAEALAEREELFFSNYESEEEAFEFLESRGMTFDRLRAMWENELIQSKLRSIVLADLGLDPESEEAETAFGDWVMDQVFASDLVFHDPDMEAFFEAGIQEISSGAGLEEDSEREADPVEDVAAVNGSADINSDGAESSGTD